MENRRSSSYLRRQELMRTLRVPTISEIKVTLGLPLALTIFEECHEALQGELGLKPHLQGPGSELWSSPSDLLIGKVCLKPPLTQKHIQALTHQGILEIGAEIEQKYWREMEIEKEEAVKEREEYLTRVFELEKTRLLNEVLESEEMKHSQQMDAMRNFFENKINELLRHCYEQVKMLEEEMQIEIDSLNVLWKEKLEEEIQSTVEKITEEFLEKLRLQEQVLTKVYKKQIETVKAKHKCATDFLKIKSKEMMLQLRHKLECQNIANLMYVLCKERRKCKGEKDALQTYYDDKVKKNKSHIKNQDNTIKRLTRCKNRRQKQLHVREKCLIEILRQFQKFIYFALKASPTQGEFLLNIERLIQFELDDYCIDLKRKTKTKTKKLDKFTEIVEDRPEISYLQVETEDQFAIALQSSDEEEYEESDALPAFYFDEKMYVREDFRDMFSAGIEIDMKHPLWNRDVDELLNMFKEKFAEKRSNYQIGNIKSHHSSVHFTHGSSDSESLVTDPTVGSYTVKSPSQTPSPQSQFLPTEKPTPLTMKKSPSIEDEELEIRKVSLAGSIDYKELKKEKKPRKSSIITREKSTTTPNEANKSQDMEIKPRLRANSQTQSRLTLARDSIILHISAMERKSLQNISKIASEEREKMSTKAEEETTIAIMDTAAAASEKPESISSTEIYEKSTEVESVKSLDMRTESETKHTSKLLLAQDSLELIKSTIAVMDKKDKEEEPELDRSPRKSLLTFNPEVIIAKSVKPAAATKQHKTMKAPYKKKAPSKTATPRPKPTAKVVGSLKTQEHEQPINEFTEERVKSLVNLIKDNPSLIRLFTKCSQ